MAPDPEDLIVREPPEPYRGEPAFGLWHFSEDPGLGHFEPHVPATNPGARPLVWAVDSRHAPLYWFPRDCPRACIWPVSTTTQEDRDRWFAEGQRRIHVIEARWRSRVAVTTLYAYRLPAESFRPDPEAGGYWTSDEPVDALGRVCVDDLLNRHRRAGIELWTVEALGPLWAEVIASTVEFSGIRLRRITAESPENGTNAPMDGALATTVRTTCATGARMTN